MDIRVEPLKKTELHDLAALFETVWKTGFEDIYKKAEWSFGNSHSKVLVAKVGDKLIGARGATEWPLANKKGIYNGLQFHDTCVHPDYRRRGIISRLINDFLKDHTQGYDLIFNCSVDAARKAYEKLGWNYLTGFRRLTLFNKGFKATRSRLGEDHPVVNEKHPPVNMDLFTRDLLEARNKALEGFLRVDYNSDFLKWRLSNTSVGYKAIASEEGVIVYKMQTKGEIRELVIGEVFLHDYTYGNFSRVLKQALNSEVPDITFTYLFTNHPVYTFFLRSFFFPNPLRMNLNFGTKIISDKLYDLDVNSRSVAFSNLDLDTF